MLTELIGHFTYPGVFLILLATASACRSRRSSRSPSRP